MNQKASRSPETIEVPATISALTRFGPEWRNSFSWPVDVRDALPIRQKSIETCFRVIKDCPAELRDIALLAKPQVAILAMSEAMFIANGASQSNIKLIGSDTIDFLTGSGSSPQTPRGFFKLPPLESPSAALFVRRLARTLSWTHPRNYLSLLTDRSSVSLNHNAVMRSFAYRSNEPIWAKYDFDYRDLIEKTTETGLSNIAVLTDLADTFAREAVGVVSVEAKIRGRAYGLLREHLARDFATATALLNAFRSARELPQRLVTGTGSKPVSRAMGLEIIRRGGTVVRSDHGGGSVLLATPYSKALTDLTVGTHFIAATKAAASSSSLATAYKLSREVANCTLVSGVGDTSLNIGRSASRSRKGRPKRPRVLYVGAALKEIGQTSLISSPGHWYLDWQFRLLHILDSFPAEISYRPHPEGYRLTPQLKPVGNFSNEKRKFEKCVRDADVILYDCPATTTLSVGLCTDRPIIFIDQGVASLSEDPKIRHEFYLRCNVIRTYLDSLYRPWVDQAILEDAIFNAPAVADPTFFRHVFLGEGQS